MLDGTQSSNGVITKPSSTSVPQTAVMLAAPLAALDIPLNVLVWEDSNGAVPVSYHSPEFLAERHHLEGAQRAPFDAVESIVEALLVA
jgi:uncharacterized protein (DUF302 family)